MRVCFSILGMSLVFAGLCSAQFETAAVLGVVRDPSGAVVIGSKVRLQNLGTGIIQTASSDNNGDYQFLDVRTGTYQLTAEAPGFKIATAGPFDVTVNARQRVDLKLQVGNTSDSITVGGEALIVEADTSDRGQLVNRDAIVDLPLNGRSNASLALLSPGVRVAYGLPKREASFNTNGQRSTYNNFILDGLDNNAYGTANQGLSNQVTQLSPDAVQEFRVVADNYSAEYGRAGGAVVNASTRSGTNELHGSAWEFLRNTDLNAVGFFKPIGGTKPTLVQNQFGGAAGGPIKKDRLFVFGDYEGFRNVARQLAFTTVPTLDQRLGIFGTPIKNPYTGQVYSGGTIPASEITPFAAKVFANLPAPNLTTSSNNYETLLPSTNMDDKGDIRLDYYLSPKVSSFFRFSEHMFNQMAAPKVDGPSGQGTGIYSRVMNYQIAGGATWTVGPTALLELRLGVSKTEGMKAPATMDGGPDMLAAYGISGLPSDKIITGGLNTQVISGIVTMGRDWSSPQHQNPFVVNPKLNYSKIWNRHTLKAGYEYQAINTEVDDFHPKYGQDTYSGQFSRPAGAKSNNIYNTADFLFGARSQYYLSNLTVANLRQRMHFLYLQDDFRATSRLTLNLGLRYEYSTPWWERDNHLSNYDPAANKLIPAANGSLYNRTLVNANPLNFAPRAGAAYAVDSKTVVRTGYGLSYIQFNRLGSDYGLHYNGPSIVVSLINQDPSEGVCASTAFSPTCFRPTQMGYPDGFTSPANFNPSVSKTMYTPRDTRTAYVQSWHFTVQRELAKNLVLDLGYVGSRGVGLIVLADYNEAFPNVTGGTLSLAARRPISTFGIIDESFSGGSSKYNALQVKLEKRYSGGLYLLNSFTWSKAMDTMAGAMESSNGDGTGVDIRNLRYNGLAISGYDQPFNNTSTVIWEVPYGKGRRYGSSAGVPLQAVLGGWRLAGINTMVAGQPISLTYTPSAAFMVTDTLSSSALTYAANVTGDPTAGQSSPSHYFNTSAVSTPTDAARPFGSAGRNSCRSSPLYQLDLSAQKDFALPGEKRWLEFRAEFFNALNKTNFSPANANVSNSNFGTITSAFPARQIQFGLKLAF
ncbi:MAG: TonB-dependent receptor [Bryobacteraceae bacterium]|jgi:hypothetical protein